MPRYVRPTCGRKRLCERLLRTELVRQHDQRDLGRILARGLEVRNSLRIPLGHREG